jgi:hypothetical protein
MLSCTSIAFVCLFIFSFSGYLRIDLPRSDIFKNGQIPKASAGSTSNKAESQSAETVQSATATAENKTNPESTTTILKESSSALDLLSPPTASPEPAVVVEAPIQLAKLESPHKCANCSAGVPTPRAFCTACGITRLPDAVGMTVKTYCVFCGLKLRQCDDQTHIAAMQYNQVQSNSEHSINLSHQNQNNSSNTSSLTTTTTQQPSEKDKVSVAALTSPKPIQVKIHNINRKMPRPSVNSRMNSRFVLFLILLWLFFLNLFLKSVSFTFFNLRCRCHRKGAKLFFPELD